jgi:hypothetical protein
MLYWVLNNLPAQWAGQIHTATIGLKSYLDELSYDLAT